MENGKVLKVRALQKLRISNETRDFIINSTNTAKVLVGIPSKRILLVMLSDTTLAIVNTILMKTIKMIHNLPNPVDLIGPFLDHRNLLLLSSANFFFAFDLSRGLKSKLLQECPFNGKIFKILHEKPNLIILVYWMDKLLAKNGLIYDIDEKKFLENIFSPKDDVLDVFYQDSMSYVIGICKFSMPIIIYSMKQRQIVHKVNNPISFMSIIGFVPQTATIVCHKVVGSNIQRSSLSARNDSICDLWMIEKDELLHMVSGQIPQPTQRRNSQVLKPSKQGRFLGRLGEFNYLLELRNVGEPGAYSRIMCISLETNQVIEVQDKQLYQNNAQKLQSHIISYFEESNQLVLMYETESQLVFKSVGF